MVTGRCLRIASQVFGALSNITVAVKWPPRAKLNLILAIVVSGEKIRIGDIANRCRSAGCRYAIAVMGTCLHPNCQWHDGRLGYGRRKSPGFARYPPIYTSA